MSRNQKSNEIAISEGELGSLTRDLVAAHEETLPSFREALWSWRDGDDAQVRGVSRRSFLARAGLVTAGGVAVAMSASGAGASVLPRITRAAGLRPSKAAPSLDVKVAALAASLENLAVATYSAGLSAAKAGKLGGVPAAVATFATTAMAQHVDHAAAWNAIISGAGFNKITKPNAALQPSITLAFAKVKDIPGLAKLALSLEDAAAATYLEAVDVVTGSKAIETAATIQPVEMQHAAILNFVLGNYPVPLAFATTTGAAPLSAVPSIS